MTDRLDAEIAELRDDPDYLAGNQSKVDRMAELMQVKYPSGETALQKSMREAMTGKVPPDPERRAVAWGEKTEIKNPDGSKFSWSQPPPKKGEGILDRPDLYKIKPEEVVQPIKDRLTKAATDQEIIDIMAEVGVELDEHDLDMFDELQQFGESLGLSEKEAGEIFGKAVRSDDYSLDYSKESGAERLIELCAGDEYLAATHLKRAQAVLKKHGKPSMIKWLEETRAGNAPSVILALSYLDRGMGGMVDDIRIAIPDIEGERKSGLQ